MKLLPLQLMDKYLQQGGKVTSQHPLPDTNANFVSTGCSEWDSIIKKYAIYHKLDMMYAMHPNTLPRKCDVLNVFKTIQPQNVKVIFIGQDPYPNAKDCIGIGFATHSNNSCPKSLSRIFSLLQTTHPHITHHDNSLQGWIEQGVLLLNACLTLPLDEYGKRDTSLHRMHSDIWHPFLTDIIRTIISHNADVVCVLMGAEARDSFKSQMLFKRHPITVNHPAARSNWFMRSKLFQKIDEYIAEANMAPINWISFPCINSRIVSSQDPINDYIRAKSQYQRVGILSNGTFDGFNNYFYVYNTNVAPISLYIQAYIDVCFIPCDQEGRYLVDFSRNLYVIYQ